MTLILQIAYTPTMTETIDHGFFARLLPFVSGEWVTLSKDVPTHLAHSRISNWRPPSAVKAHQRKPKRPIAYGTNWGRYEFRTKSHGYGTGLSAIQGRHVHVTFPVPKPYAARILGRTRANLIPYPLAEDVELEQCEPSEPTAEWLKWSQAKRREIANLKAFSPNFTPPVVEAPADVEPLDHMKAILEAAYA